MSTPTKPRYERPTLYNTIQLIPAPPGYRAKWKLDDGTFLYEPVVFFALVEAREHEAIRNDRIWDDFHQLPVARKRALCTNITTEIMPVVFDTEYQALVVLTPTESGTNFEGVEVAS